MSALPVRRLATTALCASLLIGGAAAPVFAADTAVEPARSTFAASALAADPAPPAGVLGSILSPVTGLLGGLLGTGAQPAPPAAAPAKTAPEAAAPAPAPLAAEPAEPAALPAEPAGDSAELTPQEGRKQAEAIDKAMPKDATEDQTEALAGLHDAITAYVKAAAGGDTADATSDLRAAVSSLVESLTSQWIGGAQKP